MAGWKDFREIAAWQHAEARFARIAKGSAHEVLNHLIEARDQRLITEDELMIEEHHVRKAINAMTGLIRHLETSKEPEPK